MGAVVKLFDSFGIDIHFMRYLHLALFDDRLAPHVFTPSVVHDLLVLAFVIIPAFIIAMRFTTAPVYLNYRLRINALIVPPMLPLMFLVSHWDVMFLLGLVAWMNFYVFWYHIDPSENIYHQSIYKFKDETVRDEVLKQ